MQLIYDPTEGVLAVALDNGLPEFTMRMDNLILKYDGPGGLLSFGFNAGDIDVRFMPYPESPSMPKLSPEGAGRWQIGFEPVEGATGQPESEEA